MRIFFTSFALLVGLSACGGAQHASTTPASEQVVQMDEMRITATRGENGELSVDAYDATDLFDRGNALLHEGKCDEAVVLYDRIANEFASSAFYSPALYNAGLCLQNEDKLAPAAEHFRKLIATVPDNEDTKQAHFLLSNVLIRMTAWDEAIEVSTQGLARSDLDADERMELLARRAQAHFGAHRLDQAESEARAAMTFFRTRPEDAQVRDDFYIAASNFVVAEVSRLRAEDIEIPEGTPEQQHEVLERRARFVLSAQNAYFDTIRQGNAHWASAAGYRIGALYDNFWNVITRAPVPPRPDLSAANYAIFSAEYRRELREMIRPLLQHAVRYWEMTLLMIERSGEESPYAAQIRADLERVRARMTSEYASAPTPAAPAAATP